MKVRIDPAWKRSYRWFSMQAMGLATAIVGAWAMIPEDWRTEVPSEWIKGLVAVVLVLGMIGRLVVQDPPKQPPEPEVQDDGRP